MLTTLVIQNIVLIEKLSLSFGAGLNVLTGETGAGKSIILDALGLTLGGRSDTGLIRYGADQASVSASFSLPLPKTLQPILDAQDLSIEDELILRRTLNKDGKSKAFVNDQAISIFLLKQIGETLLETHGQFETQGLLNPATHKTLLDSFAATSALKSETRSAYTAWHDAEQAFETLKKECDRAKAEEEFLTTAVAELEDLSPEKSEADALAAKRTFLQNHEKIDDALRTAAKALNGDNKLVTAAKALARIVDKAPEAEPVLKRLDQLIEDENETARQLNRLIAESRAEPASLQTIEERLFALRAIARKHNVEVDLLPEHLENLRRRRDLLVSQDDALREKAKAIIVYRLAFTEKAKKLSETRHKAAEKLSQSVMKELPPLKLERAAFVVSVTSLPESQWSADGMDQIAFLIAPNGGIPGPLHKIASGGELSRFMLALKVVLSASDPVPSLIFDEVDSGIGGATASAVGERLARLAKDVQVFVVTHSPQVAARSTNHFHVSKQTNGQKTTTSVIPLTPDNRLEEIARMLSGTHITDAARQAAQTLIDGEENLPKKAKHA